ncbi:nitroreductase family deazaflavin-dependent oxidoreductase [soil metagenome]
MADWNQKIIEEFRANEGRVGGPFEGHPLLLLHHRGARTGIERVNPLATQHLGDGAWAVFGSKGGSPTNPDWYHNLRANPDATIEVGTEVVPVRARVARGEEYQRVWSRQKQLMPGFAAYEQKTSRRIPVVILERDETRLLRSASG